MSQSQSFMVGGDSQRLNQLDPMFSYQNLLEFQCVKGPSLEELISALPHDEYEIEKPRGNDYSPSVISQLIWSFLNSRPGQIRHSGSRPDYGPNEENYLQKLLASVKRGAPIDLFLMNFSPKFANPLVAGNDISPDISYLLALQHLVGIGTSVRKIYPPGIRFVIAYEGGIYQELGKFSDEEVKQTCQNVKHFSRLVEEKAKARGIVDIVDGKELMDELGSGFIDVLRKEESRLHELYQNKKDPGFTSQFDEWRNKFALNIINLDRLIKEHEIKHPALEIGEWLHVLNDSAPRDPFLRRVRELAYESTYQLAIDYFAFHNVKYSAGKDKLGIMQNYPDAINITARADKKRLAIQLVPGTPMFPHHGITVWTGKKWEITRLIDLARYPDQFVGVALSGKENAGRTPFYYLLKDADCPGFAKPLVPFEEVFPRVLSKKGHSLMEDLSHKGTMDSRLFLAKDSNGKKVMIKYSSTDGFQGNGRPVLKREAERLKNIVDLLGGSQKAFPAVSEYHDDAESTYYAMDFFPNSETVTDHLARLPDGKTYAEKAKKIVNKLFTVLSEVYSKGSQETPKNYFSAWHLDRLRQGMELLASNQTDVFSSYLKNKEFKIGNAKYNDLTDFFKEVFSHETVKINGAEFLNFPALLKVIQKHEGEINRKLNPPRIPIITHGDPHLSNVLINNLEELLLVDPYGRRPINAVESELGRLNLSFFADFLRKKNYEINVSSNENDELKMNLYSTGANDDLLLGMSKVRDEMADLVKAHDGIYNWVQDTEDWKSHILLTEAIHIPVVAANKFASDPSGKLTLGCYIVGTVLMNNALAKMGIADPKYGAIESPIELFMPSGRYSFQKDEFLKKLAGSKSETEGIVDYAAKSLEKVKKHG
jgi:hypothetical protein